MMSVYRSSPMVPMSVILLICLISLSEANATSSFPSSLITNSTSASSQSWRNATTSTSASNSHPTEHAQGGSITEPGYYLTTETSSYIETKTLNSGVSETVTLLDGSVTVEVGLAVFTDLNVETYVQANLYSTQSKSFYPWDPSQFSGLWNVPESYRTGPPSLLSLWSSYTSYARQSACREDFSQFVATQSVTSIATLADLYYKNPTTVGDLDTPGYTREIQTNAYLEHCCGNCEFVYRSVQLFYWPAEHPNTDCYRTAGSAVSTTSAPTQLRLRGFSENSSITSAPNGLVVATDEDGFT